jgi:hypothetical protein
MEELLITIMLVIPAPDKHIDWSINEIPTQIQLIHEGGTEVSYHAMPIPCGYKARTKMEMVFTSSQAHEQDRCYSVFDLTSPTFIRHPNYWHSIELPKPHDPR